jgi:hypothetical protein
MGANGFRIPDQLFTLVMAALGVLATFLATRYWYNRTAATKETDRLAVNMAALLARVDVLDKQLSLLSQAVVPISTAYQTILVRELTHYHTPRVDSLLEKLGPPALLTAAEEEELLCALKAREADMGDLITDQEREAAHILPVVIKRVKTEIAEIAHGTGMLQLVVVPLSSMGPETVEETP